MRSLATFGEATRAAAHASCRPRVEFVGPFVEAAVHVLRAELDHTPAKGQLHRIQSDRTATDVSAVVAVTGDIAGLVIVSMAYNVARHIVTRMVGWAIDDIQDPMALSAISELANMVIGRASMGLEQNGYSTSVSPPIVYTGLRARIAPIPVPRLVIPLVTRAGEVRVETALRSRLDDAETGVRPTSAG